MAFETIIYTKENGIARMTVNRPEKRNALNRATRLEMLEALEDTIRDSEVKVLILSGAGGKSFVAGSDLNELARMNPLEMERFAATLAQQFYHRFEQMDKPVIAMIDGLCLGGGLELAMACDIRIASETSRFGQPEIFLGFMPGSGGTQRLPKLVGLGKAKELIFTGKMIDAAEALEIGLINGPADRRTESPGPQVGEKNHQCQPGPGADHGPGLREPGCLSPFLQPRPGRGDEGLFGETQTGF
jgi:enoyl-CoA hydratase